MPEGYITFKVTLELSISDDDVSYTHSKRYPTPEELKDLKERLVSDLEYYVHESDMLITMLDDTQEE